MEKNILISVKEVSRYYGDYCAVDNISFSVHRGEVLGFLGPNGAGKTTTMQMISGVLAANTGEISIAGFDIVEQAKQAKSHVGFLPEQPPLYLDLSVDEYLHYAARLRGIKRSDLQDAVENSKQRCGLEDMGKRLIRNLSRGYQQRIGIAQAIIHSPDVVILDEPTAGLDPNQILEIRELVNELGNDHSVILSTHILPEVQSVCDRVLIINEGILVLDQPLESLQKDTKKLSLIVAFKKPPSLETIMKIDGFEVVDQLDEQRFHVSCHIDSDTIDKLIQQSSNSCWGLFEMIPEKDTLEDVFVRLTSGDVNRLTRNNNE